jgi:glycosyltransferase involved in cell wall biosynthesis
MQSEGQSNRRLTVAHFIASNIMGGVEVATLRLTATTHAQFRHIAFCFHDAVTLKDLFEKQGIETISYTPPTPSIRHGLRFYKESLALAMQLRNAGVDIVHFSDKFAAYFSSLAALLARTRIACHVRLSHPRLTLRDRLSLLPVQSYIFVSKEAMRTFAISLPDTKARVIYDAIEVSDADWTESNLAVRREFSIPSDCPLIGVIARVAPQKDFFTLADAAAETVARYPNTRFLVIGEHSSNDALRTLFEDVVHKLTELGISDNFIFTGYRNDVPRLIAAIDISVLCTHREGFPLSILESMAMHKPMIATDVGGISEIIEEGVTGYLHPHGNSNELARKMISLIEDPEKAKHIGMAGYQHVRHNYSLQKYIDEISNAYTDLMRR